MKDYSGIAATAVRLINNYGRNVTIEQLDSGNLQDANNPQDGFQDSAGDDVKAVFDIVEIQNADVQKCATTCIVAPVENRDVNGYKKLTDGTEEWNIAIIKEFKPGDRVLYWELGLTR